MNSVFLLGFFDSVHRGHRRLVEKAKKTAQKIDGDILAFTFDDELYSVLGRDDREIYLLRERKKIFASLGVKTFVLPTNSDFFATEYTDFLDYLRIMRPSAIVVGKDYTFGKNAVGNAEILKDYFKKLHIPVTICDLLTENGVKVSTSDIRRAILDGDMETASTMLGAPFFISGKVVDGYQNGRKLSLPTANIEFDRHKIIPKSGVYSSLTHVDGESFLSVSNVGNHPTFGYEGVNFETHLINYDGDLYGKEIRVDLKKYIRPIKLFSDPEELRLQIMSDIETVLKEDEQC